LPTGRELVDAGFGTGEASPGAIYHVV